MRLVTTRYNTQRPLQSYLTQSGASVLTGPVLGSCPIRLTVTSNKASIDGRIPYIYISGYAFQKLWSPISYQVITKNPHTQEDILEWQKPVTRPVQKRKYHWGYVSLGLRWSKTSSNCKELRDLSTTKASTNYSRNASTIAGTRETSVDFNGLHCQPT